jgi:hypothetical protein
MAVALLATSLSLAAPAQAGVSPSLITVSDQGGDCVLSSTSVTGNPGSAFTLAVGADCRVLGPVLTGDPVVSPADLPRIDENGHVTYTMVAVGTGTLELDWVNALGKTMAATITVTVTDSFVAEPVIHDDLQQVGVPASGDCADVPASVGHYPGFPIGGWSKSWAWWINDGAGGPVCTREVEELPNGTVVLVG